MGFGYWGQGYDSSSNMSSSRTGVQGWICAVAPLASYTHCQAHQLSFCVVKGCSIHQFRNASCVISEIARFLVIHLSVNIFFEKVIHSSAEPTRIEKLKDVCRTRWIERIDLYLVFYELYFFIVATCTCTMEGISSQISDYGEWSWDSDTITKAI